jgi:hypothetical protein
MSEFPAWMRLLSVGGGPLPAKHSPNLGKQFFIRMKSFRRPSFCPHRIKSVCLSFLLQAFLIFDDNFIDSDL